jgi:hypothetical protein
MTSGVIADLSGGGPDAKNGASRGAQGCAVPWQVISFYGLWSNHMGRKSFAARGIVALALAVGGGAFVLAADGPAKAPEKPAAKPKYELSEIMNKGHKGNDSLLKKVTTGKATPAETKKLVEYYQAMVLHAPPKGDEKSWKEKTTALLKASESAAAKKAGAVALLEKAANCKACHAAHKPD